jgi:predicted nucleic acid-binding protein
MVLAVRRKPSSRVTSPEEFGRSIPRLRKPTRKFFPAVNAPANRRSQPDLMIAAIALSRDLRVVTRNVRDFEGCGVAVIDPREE